MTLRSLHLGVSLLCILSLVGCALPGSTAPVLKVGLVAPFEGWYRPRGYDALWAVRLAIQEAQAMGGLAGWQVELVALDDHLDPHWAPQRARELVADPAVLGVGGGLSPAVVDAARAVYTGVGLPLVTLASVPARGDGVYVLAPSPEALARAAADHIGGEGGDCVALLHGGGQDAWAAALQASMQITASVTLGGREWAETLLAAHPDWVISTVDARLGGQAIRLARREGLGASLMGGPEWGTDAFARVASDPLHGTWFVTGAPRGADLAEAGDFVAAYREVGGHEPGPDAVLAYDATRALLAALARTIEEDGCPTRQGVSAALASVSLQGVTGPVQFDRGGARSAATLRVYRAGR